MPPPPPPNSTRVEVPAKTASHPRPISRPLKIKGRPRWRRREEKKNIDAGGKCIGRSNKNDYSIRASCNVFGSAPSFLSIAVAVVIIILLFGARGETTETIASSSSHNSRRGRHTAPCRSWGRFFSFSFFSFFL